MEISKLKQILTKADKLQKGKEVALANEFISMEEQMSSLSNKTEKVQENLENILENIKEIDNKEVKTYETELVNLLESIKDIKTSIDNKETIVNIPLEPLAESLNKIEVILKSIKIPEFPSELSVNNLDEVVNAIKSIPEFPLKDINTLIAGLEGKLAELRIEIPDFDYVRIENHLKDIVTAIKNIKISGGGGTNIVGLFDTTGTKINPATEETLQSITDTIKSVNIPAHDYIELSYTGSDLTGVIYKTGGSSGTVVATLTLAYTGGNLTSVTKVLS